ncbi:hypothetical protein [Streptomyces sp. NPDC093808]|uniref:hypothetical protein n=1 Tax=unclassified Streptomyces TaxID=2593676 RepID=UPI00344BDB5F
MPGAPPVPAGEAGAPAPPDAGSWGRRRGRTAALIGAALVLGLVAGTCTGYLVQAGRAPTPLPPLSQPVLAQARGEAPAPLPAAQDRRVRTDGDLRELLLRKPRGATYTEWLKDGVRWLDLTAVAETWTEPGEAFGDLVRDEFRRSVMTVWEDDGHTVEIRLTQFRQEEYTAALHASEEARGWAEELAGDSWLIPGTGDGRAYVMTEPETEPGFEDQYTAEAHAWRGDIAMDVWVTGPEPVGRNKIMDVAERQMERL